MPVTTELQLLSPFSIFPEQLLGVEQAMPVNNQYFIPLDTALHEYLVPTSFIVPTLKRLGNGAVEMSLDEPFGFVSGAHRQDGGLETQKTTGIEIIRHPDAHDRWITTLHTELPLTRYDERLFDQGLSIYATHATLKIRNLTRKRPAE